MKLVAFERSFFLASFSFLFSWFLSGSFWSLAGFQSFPIFRSEDKETKQKNWPHGLPAARARMWENSARPAWSPAPFPHSFSFCLSRIFSGSLLPFFFSFFSRGIEGAGRTGCPFYVSPASYYFFLSTWSGKKQDASSFAIFSALFVFVQR